LRISRPMQSDRYAPIFEGLVGIPMCQTFDVVGVVLNKLFGRKASVATLEALLSFP